MLFRKLLEKAKQRRFFTKGGIQILQGKQEESVEIPLEKQKTETNLRNTSPLNPSRSKKLKPSTNSNTVGDFDVPNNW